MNGHYDYEFIIFRFAREMPNSAIDFYASHHLMCNEAAAYFADPSSSDGKKKHKSIENYEYASNTQGKTNNPKIKRNSMM